MTLTARIRGIPQTTQRLRTLPDRLDSANRANADALLRIMQGYMPSRTGAMIASAEVIAASEPHTWQVAVFATYAAFVNNGTRRMVGQRFAERAILAATPDALARLSAAITADHG